MTSTKRDLLLKRCTLRKPLFEYLIAVYFHNRFAIKSAGSEPMWITVIWQKDKFPELKEQLPRRKMELYQKLSQIYFKLSMLHQIL